MRSYMDLFCKRRRMCKALYRSHIQYPVTQKCIACGTRAVHGHGPCCVEKYWSTRTSIGQVVSNILYCLFVNQGQHFHRALLYIIFTADSCHIPSIMSAFGSLRIVNPNKPAASASTPARDDATTPATERPQQSDMSPSTESTRTSSSQGMDTADDTLSDMPPPLEPVASSSAQAPVVSNGYPDQLGHHSDPTLDRATLSPTPNSTATTTTKIAHAPIPQSDEHDEETHVVLQQQVDTLTEAVQVLSQQLDMANDRLYRIEQFLLMQFPSDTGAPEDGPAEDDNELIDY